MFSLSYPCPMIWDGLKRHLDYKKSVHMSHNDTYIQEINDLNIMLEFMFCTTEQVYVPILAI